MPLSVDSSLNISVFTEICFPIVKAIILFFALKLLIIKGSLNILSIFFKNVGENTCSMYFLNFLFNPSISESISNFR